jgi:hypothetical protein
MGFFTIIGTIIGITVVILLVAIGLGYILDL